MADQRDVRRIALTLPEAEEDGDLVKAWDGRHPAVVA